MTLHAILNWYDESPTWLAGCVASLSKIGVEHLVAVDGRYPHFAPGSPTRSAIDQVDAVTSAADGIGIAVTLHTLRTPVPEPVKRTIAFSLLEAVAAFRNDWVLVIDADEVIADGSLRVGQELAALPDDTHVASALVSSTVDPYADPAPDNDVTEYTEKIHRTQPTPQTYTHLQSRFWRVLRNMECLNTHFNYTGIDEFGVTWNLRPDIGVQNVPHLPKSDIVRPETTPRLLHRKNQRTRFRQTLKRTYYADRNELGLERVP